MENSYVQCYGIYIKLLEIIHNTKKNKNKNVQMPSVSLGQGVCMHIKKRIPFSSRQSILAGNVSSFSNN